MAPNAGPKISPGIASHLALGRTAPMDAIRPVIRSLRSNFRLLGHLQRVIDLDAQVPHGAFELRMAKQ